MNLRSVTNLYLDLILRKLHTRKIKSTSNLGNVYYHSVQSLSPCLLTRKIKMYKTIIRPTVLYGCETWHLTLMEEHRLKVSGC
jgi:hypothetical protein